MNGNNRQPADPRKPGSDNAVVRVWRGWASPEQADAYEEYVAREVLPGQTALDGYLGGSYYRRAAADDEVEFLVITRWNSFDAIIGFAGADNPAQATIPEKAAAMLLSYDAEALHYEDVPVMWPEGFSPR